MRDGYTGPAYGRGEVVEYTVTFDRPVTVTPFLHMDRARSETHYNVNYASGSGTQWLAFRYTVPSDHHSSLVPISLEGNSVQLNSGTITDARDGTTAADLTFSTHIRSVSDRQEHHISPNANLAVIVVSARTLAVTEGSTGAYTVWLNKAPSSDVVVTATKSSPLLGLQRPGEQARAATETLTFTTSDWNTGQTVLVYGEDDPDTASGSATVTHAVVDAQSANDFDRTVDERLPVSVTDNDVAALVLSASRLSVTEGQEATYTLRLSHVPTGDVRVLPRRRDAAHVRVSTTAVGPYAGEWSLMTFTASNWNTAQTVYVEGREDGDFSANCMTLDHAVYAPESAGEYAAVTATLTVDATDNDMNPLVLNLQAITAEEGGELHGDGDSDDGGGGAGHADLRGDELEHGGGRRGPGGRGGVGAARGDGGEQRSGLYVRGAGGARRDGDD